MRCPRAAFLVLVLPGCAVLRDAPDRAAVSAEIERRVGAGVGASASGAFTLPEGISLDDGLTEDEAVAVALWNNAALQADLATLGIARADLLQAGLLRNPVLSLLFPVGPKQAEATLALPLAEIWQRPRRVAAAKLDVRRVADDLVEHGLALARDARIALAEVSMSEQRARLADESARLLDDVASIAEARLSAGDASVLEARAARVEALLAREAARRRSQEAESSRYRMLTVLGLEPDGPRIAVSGAIAGPGPIASLSTLVDRALAARPDLRAAEARIEAEGERAGWERSRAFHLIGLIDANETADGGSDVGPGAQVELPIFDWNRSGRLRAAARLQQAAWDYVGVRRRIVLGVHEAYTRFRSAEAAHREWGEEIVPSLEGALRQVQSAHATGEVSRLAVLEATRRLVEARVRDAEVLAELRRERANLLYRVGMDAGGES